MNAFFINLVIASLFGCATAGQILVQQIGFKRDAVLLFVMTKGHNFHKFHTFSRLLVKSLYHGRESVSFIGLKVWNILPDDCKDMNDLNAFRNPGNLSCKLKIYMNNIGFA